MLKIIDELKLSVSKCSNFASVNNNCHAGILVSNECSADRFIDILAIRKDLGLKFHGKRIFVVASFQASCPLPVEEQFLVGMLDNRASGPMISMGLV